MNRLAPSGLALALAGMLMGCAPRYADVPAPTRFENTRQEKVQAAEHWHAIAAHFAQQLAGDLHDKLGSRAVYVPTPGGEQAFVEGFRELLITELVAQGLPVATDSRNALSVEVRYSIYRFSPERAKNTYVYGEATALAAGLWAVGAVAAADISPVAGISTGVKALTAVAGLEAFAWISNEALRNGQYASGPVPQSEILLTATVADKSLIVSRRSNIYYAVDADEALYWKRSVPQQARMIPVFGDCADGGRSCAR